MPGGAPHDRVRQSLIAALARGLLCRQTIVKSISDVRSSSQSSFVLGLHSTMYAEYLLLTLVTTAY